MTITAENVRVPKAMSKAVDEESMRHALHNVAVVPGDGRTWLVATDGRILAARTTDGRTERLALLPADLIPKIKSGGVATLNGQWEVRKANGRDRSVNFGTEGEGHFPDVKQVIPRDYEDRTHVRVDLRLLRDLLDALEGEEGPDGRVTVDIHIGDERMPVMLTTRDGVGIIITLHGGKQGVPDFKGRWNDTVEAFHTEAQL